MSEVTQATETTGTDIATLPPAERAVIVLDSHKAEEQLRAMLTETADITEVKDKDSRTMAHNAAMKLKNARVAIEKTGKTARDDANAFAKAVIAEEKRLTAIITPEEDRLLALRNEYDRKVEEERLERERKERERVAAIRGQIDAIKALPLDSASDTSEQLHGTIHELMDLPIGDDFAEFKEEAEAAKWEAISALQQMWDSATEREAAAARLKAEEERLQAEREKLAAERAEEEARLQAERDKLAAERAELEALRSQLAAKQQPAAQPEPVAEQVIEEAPAEPVQEPLPPADVQPELFGVDLSAGPDESVQVDVQVAEEPANDTDANAFVRQLAAVTAKQFIALADKVEAVGHLEFANTLRDDAAAIDAGVYDQALLAADWTAMANADKAMALASHAGVALVFGDEAMGGAVLLQAAE